MFLNQSDGFHRRRPANRCGYDSTETRTHDELQLCFESPARNRSSCTKHLRFTHILTCIILGALLAINVQVPKVGALQQVGAMQPTFVRTMDSLNVKENTPVGEVIYTLKATLDQDGPAESRFLYAIDGTNLFSVDKTTGQVRVAQPIDREQTSDSVQFQVSATPVYQSEQTQKYQFGPTTQLSVTVYILDENDTPPRIERVRVGRNEFDHLTLARQSFAHTSPLNARSPVVQVSVRENVPVGSVIVDLIEAIDVDKASSNPLRAFCVDCEPEFELKSTSSSQLNDRVNTSIVLSDTLVHVPRNNVRYLHIGVDDGKFNSTIIFEVTIEDVQNKPPQFIGSTTCIVAENVSIDKTIMTLLAIDGDAVALDDTASSLPKNGHREGRQILYDLVAQSDPTLAQIYENFKLHPLTGQLQVANRLDREAYLSLNGVLSLRVRARELTIPAETIARQDELYDSLIARMTPHVDPSPEATSEVEITVILVDVNDNEPRWLNSSEIAALSLDKSPTWFNGLPKDKDTGRLYQLQVKENSLVGTPITTRNEMFVYDLDSGENASFNISIVDPFNLFDVEPKQVSGFALVTLKLARTTLTGPLRPPTRLLDYENPNERIFIIQVIATETNTNQRFTSKAQIQINVLDVNDNVPEFREQSYHANIREDAPPGKSVLLVQATDRDEVSRQLTYSLHGRSAYLFDIGRRSGLITVARCDSPSARICLDYEHQRSHHLMVEVSDGELSSKVPLTIFIDDASDHWPVFSLPIVDAVIEEGADRLDPPIKIEATDVDQSSVISYSIVEGNFESLFSINNMTGELQLTRPIRISHDDATTLADDYRQQQLNKIILVIQATDGSKTANGTVRIDVLDANDNAPKFLRPQYSAELQESSQPGTFVTTVRAVDSDRGNNARVSYKLTRGSYGQFEINESSGMISVGRQARPFDAFRRNNYSLEVVAYDHGIVSKSSAVLVQVTILETVRRAPEFEPKIQRASVHESSLNNTIVHRMTVANQDQLGGALLVFEPGPIEALDKNGQPVALGETGRLESMFGVSTNTGDVLVHSALDHEFAAHVNLTIFVSSRSTNHQTSTISMDVNASAPSETMEEFNPKSVGYLIINVVDDNSNAPVFAAPWTPHQPELSFQMLEELPVGSILTQLVASDADSRISHFKIDPPSDYFELTSAQSGVIVNKRVIDYDTLMSQTFLTPGSHRPSPSGTVGGNNIIQFNVHVFDSGQPQLSAKATVSVEILPVNDWDCRFEQQVYEVRVKENAPTDTLLLQVRANDLDFGELHNTVRYQLVGEHGDFFNIDPKSGLITVSSKGSVNLDRERLSQSSFALTIVGRDEQPASQSVNGSDKRKLQSTQATRTCSATLRVHVDDVNDNPPLFSQKTYEVTAYDTDQVDVPLVRLLIRDDDTHTAQAANGTPTLRPIAQPSNSFKILSGNVNESFNISNAGVIYATKPLNESLATLESPMQLRIQVRQQSASPTSGALTSFTDECIVRINFVRINRYGPEWRFSATTKAISVVENARPGTLVTQLRCVDRDYDSRAANKLAETDELASSDKLPSANLISPIRYSIKVEGANVLETREFKLDPISGKMVTRLPLDRETQDLYQLVVACEDNGKPQSLESISPLYISVLDVDDNKPEFVVSRNRETAEQPHNARKSSAKFGRPTWPRVNFVVEEHQGKGLTVGELRAVDRDLDNSLPISYCLIEGNEFQEFSLDRVTGILYTNQSLDRERQSSYDLLVKAINDGSNCDSHMVAFQATRDSAQPNSTKVELDARTARNLGGFLVHTDDNSREPSSLQSSLISVKVDVQDINDNPPTFRRPIHRAGIQHRSLMNTLVTQVPAFDPDSGSNGTLTYKISEILMYKTNPMPHQSSSRKYEVSSEQPLLSKPIKLIQFPFRIDQQGNIYTQQLLTQYQLMSMFVLQLEAAEKAEPWRTARTKVEIYIYETSSQLKVRINLHPRLIDTYRSEIETLLSNATKYNAIINRARSYGGAFDKPSTGGVQATLNSKDKQSRPSVDLATSTNPQVSGPSRPLESAEEPSLSNIHLIFVDNFRIVNPELVMKKLDLKSAQLFMPQTLTELSSGANEIGQDGQSRQLNGDVRSAASTQQLQANEVSSLIDKIALVSVTSAEYHASPSSIVGVDWLESPSVLYVAITTILVVAGFVVFLFGCCCCTSRIKDHIFKVAMDKVIEQRNLQTKINEQMLAATNPASIGMRGSGNQADFMMQGGYMSSFDTTKGCITNNNDNMNILQRAMESGEFLDPNYTTLNGHVNMGAHYYDTTELDQQATVSNDGRQSVEQTGNELIMAGEQINGSNISLAQDERHMNDDDVDLSKLGKRNGHIVSNGNNGNIIRHNVRQRQQIPNN